MYRRNISTPRVIHSIMLPNFITFRYQHRIFYFIYSQLLFRHSPFSRRTFGNIFYLIFFSFSSITRVSSSLQLCSCRFVRNISLVGQCKCGLTFIRISSTYSNLSYSLNRERSSEPVTLLAYVSGQRKLLYRVYSIYINVCTGALAGKLASRSRGTRGLRRGKMYQWHLAGASGCDVIKVALNPIDVCQRRGRIGQTLL